MPFIPSFQFVENGWVIKLRIFAAHSAAEAALSSLQRLGEIFLRTILVLNRLPLIDCLHERRGRRAGKAVTGFQRPSIIIPALGKNIKPGLEVGRSWVERAYLSYCMVYNKATKPLIPAHKGQQDGYRKGHGEACPSERHAMLFPRPPPRIVSGNRGL